MPTKTITITAQSKIGWASLGSEQPTERGTIATVNPPAETLQWFVGRRSERGSSLDACNWFPIVSTAQVCPNGYVNPKVEKLYQIHGDIIDFLWDFDIQVEYIYESKAGRPTVSDPRHNRTIRLSDRAWQNIQTHGGAAMVEEWANRLY